MKAKVTNEDLLVEMKISKEADKPTETLGKMFVWIANNHGNRPQWRYYPHRDDMVQHAILQMLVSYKMFNPEKSDNPFAYLVTVAGCAFANFLNKEAREERHEL